MRGTFLGVPIIRIIVCWSLYWGTLILGNYHFRAGVQGLGVQGFRVSGFWSSGFKTLVFSGLSSRGHCYANL